MTRMRLAAAAVLAPHGGLAPGWLEVEDGRVVAHGDGSPGDAAVDLGDLVLAPGFVDIQVNGVDAVDFMTAHADDWATVAVRLVGTGVTSYLPTVVSAPRRIYDDALAGIASASVTHQAPRIDGVHLEGPFLGAAPGAHPPGLLGPVDLDWLLALCDRHPLVRMVTLAPEADPGLAGTRALVARGITVSLGHSRCSYEDALAAADAGARAVTHLFNGMGPLHHREPGLPGAALDCDALTPTLIADLVHVHPALVRIAAARRPDLALVTDAVAVGIEYFGQAVVAREGAAYLPDGTLTGSTLTMDRAVRNVVELGIPLATALAMAAVAPARLVGLDTYGALGIGGRADFVALDRESLEVRATWVDGTLIG